MLFLFCFVSPSPGSFIVEIVKALEFGTSVVWSRCAWRGVC